jgi:hypothetical protein
LDWRADPITNLTLLEDEFEYRIATKKAEKRMAYDNIEDLPDKRRLRRPRTPSVKKFLKKTLKWQALLDSMFSISP